MSHNTFLTGQDILESLDSVYTPGLEKDAAWLAAAGRRALTAIPKWFMGRNMGLQGTARVINRMFGGGRTRMAGQGATRVYGTGRGVYNTNTGNGLRDTANRVRNWVLDKTYAADKALGRANKRINRFETASDAKAFGGPRYIDKVENVNGIQTISREKNPEYRAGLAGAAKTLGVAGGMAGVTALGSVPVVGDLFNVASAFTPVGAAFQLPNAFTYAQNKLTDKVIVPTATNAAYGAMQSTLDAVNNMDTWQRLGFLLSPEQARQQMQAQAEQEFGRQAFAQQQELWRQRREG